MSLVWLMAKQYCGDPEREGWMLKVEEVWRSVIVKSCEMCTENVLSIRAAVVERCCAIIAAICLVECCSVT